MTSIRFSIITACFNSDKTITRCINSVKQQNFNEYEHIIIDGASIDSTLRIIMDQKDDRIVCMSEPDEGIYDAMNKGIAHAKGKYIFILNSDDYFSSEDSLTILNDHIIKTDSKLISGNIYIVDDDDKTVRTVLSKRFRTWMMRFGWMLPHPATCVAAEYYNQFGRYDTTFRTAADFEFLARLVLRHKIEFSVIDQVISKMATGGATTSGFSSYWLTTKEINRALKRYNIYTPIIILLMRLPIKYLTQKI